MKIDKACIHMQKELGSNFKVIYHGQVHNMFYYYQNNSVEMRLKYYYYVQ